MQGERANHSLEPSALVNALCVRLFGAQPVSYQDRAHFFALAAQMMRRILIDQAGGTGRKARRRAATRESITVRLWLFGGQPTSGR